MWLQWSKRAKGECQLSPLHYLAYLNHMVCNRLGGRWASGFSGPLHSHGALPTSGPVSFGRVSEKLAARCPQQLGAGGPGVGTAECPTVGWSPLPGAWPCLPSFPIERDADLALSPFLNLQSFQWVAGLASWPPLEVMWAVQFRNAPLSVLCKLLSRKAVMRHKQWSPGQGQPWEAMTCNGKKEVNNQLK